MVLSSYENLYQCDRCGKRDRADDKFFWCLPQGWATVYGSEHYHLCDTCADMYYAMMDKFISELTEDNADGQVD